MYLYMSWIRSARPAKVRRKRSKAHRPQAPPKAPGGACRAPLWVLECAFASPWPAARCESTAPGPGVGFAFGVDFGDLPGLAVQFNRSCQAQGARPVQLWGAHANAMVAFRPMFQRSTKGGRYESW